MSVVHLTNDEMREFERSAAAEPAIAKLNEITVAHAERSGGRVREYWRLHMGRLFGEPWMMTQDECAKRMGLPVSEVARIARDSQQAINAEWHATDAYRRSQFADLHRRKREG